MNGYTHLSHSFIINAFSLKTARDCRIFNDLILHRNHLVLNQPTGVKAEPAPGITCWQAEHPISMYWREA